MIERSLFLPVVTRVGVGASIAFVAFAVAPASAQTPQETAPAAQPAPPSPPDVSRIVIRRPTGSVIPPESYRVPTPVDPDAVEQEEAAAEGSELIEAGDGADLDGIEQEIFLREAPTGPDGAPVASVPNATSADVNDPGVRVRIPAPTN